MTDRCLGLCDLVCLWIIWIEVVYRGAKLMNFETTIGLEVHIEMKTNSKAYSPAPVVYGAEPNTNTNVPNMIRRLTSSPKPSERERT